MRAQTPEQAHALFVQFFNDGDVDAIVSLYEPNALLIPFPGPPVQGHHAIREAIQGFLSLKGHMTLIVDKVFQTGDVALLFSTWVLKAVGPDGKPLEMTGQTSDVVRRQADGSWLYVIDNPQGAAAAAKAGM